MIQSRRARGSLLCGAVLLVLALAGGCGERGSSTPSPDALMANAKAERAKGNHSASIIHLKNVVQKAPDNPEARYLLGLAYYDIGDMVSAEKELRRALELRHDSAKVVPPLLRTLLAQGEFQKLLDQAKGETGGDDQGQAEILTLRALASLGLGRGKEGRELLDQALQKQPEFADALLGQARLAAAERKLDEAGRLIDRAIASSPKSIDAWLMKGDLERLVNREAAPAAYQKVLELNPQNVQARLNMASMLIGAGKYDEARVHLSEVNKVAPRSPMIRYMEGLIEFRKSNYAASREAVAQVLKVAPNHMPSVLLAGAVEYALGSHAQAQAHLSRVVDRAPGNLYARKLLVASLARSGNTQRAFEVLGPGLAQAPRDAALMALAGEVAIQANDAAKAREYFDKAAALDPKSAGARTGLAVSRLASGETDRALADLEAAAELDSEKYQADILLVTSHLQRAQYDHALKAVQSLEKKQPKNPLTYNLKAAIYLGKKDTANARKTLEYALELQPTYFPAAINLAQLDLAEKNPQSARRRLEVIVEKDKDSAQALMALAELGPRIGATPKEQGDWLERARKASPALVPPKLALARFYAQSGEPKKALDVAQQAQAAHPASPEVLEMLGSIQSAAGEKNQAIATYGKLVAMQPKSPVALYRLAGAQALNNDAAGAGASLRKALELKPDFLDAQAMLATLEIRAGRFPDAMKVARQVQKQAAKSPLGFVLEADVLMAEKKYPQAAKAYETAFAMAKNGPVALKMHAAYTQAGKPDEADARLAQWLKAAPDDAVARLYAADAGLKTGKYKSAIEQYEWLQQKQPDNIVVLNNLAWAYQQVNDKRAVATAERAYKLKPDNPSVIDTLGWIVVEQGDLKRGLELLQKAVSLAPGAQQIRYHLAQAWVKAGDKEKARTELERIAAAGTRFPQETEAMSLLKQLKN